MSAPLHSEYLPDIKLARALVEGDERAFTRFFDEYAPRLYRFALQCLNHNAGAAEEVAQRALCRAVQKISQYRGEASLFTWLCQICRREASRYLTTTRRDAQRFTSVEDDPDLLAALESLPIDASLQPSAVAERSDLVRLVQAVLDHLPTHYADALEWKYIEDLEVNTIAERLLLTPLAAQSLLARARRAFHDAWERVTGESLETEVGVSEGTS